MMRAWILWDSTARQQWFDNALEVWSVETLERMFALSGHTDKVTHIEFQPNGVLLASASEDGTVRLWDVETGELTLSKTFNGNLISDITFSPDGQFLAIVDGSAFPESANNRVVIHRHIYPERSLCNRPSLCVCDCFLVLMGRISLLLAQTRKSGSGHWMKVGHWTAGKSMKAASEYPLSTLHLAVMAGWRLLMM